MVIYFIYAIYLCYLYDYLSIFVILILLLFGLIYQYSLNKNEYGNNLNYVLNNFDI